MGEIHKMRAYDVFVSYFLPQLAPVRSGRTHSRIGADASIYVARAHVSKYS